MCREAAIVGCALRRKHYLANTGFGLVMDARGQLPDQATLVSPLEMFMFVERRKIEFSSPSENLVFDRL